MVDTITILYLWILFIVKITIHALHISDSYIWEEMGWIYPGKVVIIWRYRKNEKDKSKRFFYLCWNKINQTPHWTSSLKNSQWSIKPYAKSDRISPWLLCWLVQSVTPTEFSHNFHLKISHTFWKTCPFEAKLFRRMVINYTLC